jgi:hypothetical protein
MTDSSLHRVQATVGQSMRVLIDDKEFVLHVAAADSTIEPPPDNPPVIDVTFRPVDPDAGAAVRIEVKSDE